MSETSETSLVERILTTLKAAGRDLDKLTELDLAPIDQFHNGGTWATRKLLTLAEFPACARVLDIGGGIGGPARTLAREGNFRVTVLDLTVELCQAGRTLTRMLGSSELVEFVCGDALRLPLANECVDAILLQNAAMNIPDKQRLAAELFRVLRPGGRLAFQEVMLGPIEPVRYPSPWAIDRDESFLRTPDTARETMAEAGFAEIHWLDASDLIRSWAKARIGSKPGRPLLPPMTSFTMPPDVCDLAIRNMWRNGEEKRTVTYWAVLEKPARHIEGIDR